MRFPTNNLDDALRAVCPIHGVSIGRRDDKTTWRIDFTSEATLAQRVSAQAVVDAFDAVAVAASIESQRLDKEALASSARLNTAFENLRTEAEISAFVLRLFPAFTPAQRAVLSLLVQLAVLQGATTVLAR